MSLAASPLYRMRRLVISCRFGPEGAAVTLVAIVVKEEVEAGVEETCPVARRGLRRFAAVGRAGSG